jgi:hypothetical protein
MIINIHVVDNSCDEVLAIVRRTQSIYDVTLDP